MKTVYVGHSSNCDFKTELYHPLRESKLHSLYSFILPHEENLEPINTREVINTADFMLAEVSYPSTGLGIELGWANVARIPVIFLYKSGTKPSSSLNFISNSFIEYTDSHDMIEKLATFLEKQNLQK